MTVKGRQASQRPQESNETTPVLPGALWDRDADRLANLARVEAHGPRKPTVDLLGAAHDAAKREDTTMTLERVTQEAEEALANMTQEAKEKESRQVAQRLMEALERHRAHGLDLVTQRNKALSMLRTVAEENDRLRAELALLRR